MILSSFCKNLGCRLDRRGGVSNDANCLAAGLPRARDRSGSRHGAKRAGREQKDKPNDSESKAASDQELQLQTPTTMYMSSSTFKLTLGLAAVAAMASGTQAQSAAAAKAPPPSAFDQWADGIKKPTDWLTWGADFRLRDEYLPNSVSLSDSAPTPSRTLSGFGAGCGRPSRR